MPSRSEEKLARIEKKMEKQQMRDERKRQQSHKDSGNAIWAICGLAVMHCILVAVPLFGDRWQYAGFHGSFVGTVTVTSGMLFLDMEIECETNFLERGMCKQLQKLDLTGQTSIYRARERFCGAGPLPLANFCAVFTVLQWSNVYLAVLLIGAMIAHLLSCGFLYIYWFVQPLATMRRWAMFFYCIAPVMHILGLLGWTCCVYNMSDMPRALSIVLGTPTLGVVGFTGIYHVPYGWCWFFSVCHAIFCVIFMLVWLCFFYGHESEDLCEDEEFMKLYSKEGELEGSNAKEGRLVGYHNYGATDVQPSPPNFVPGMGGPSCTLEHPPYLAPQPWGCIQPAWTAPHYGQQDGGLNSYVSSGGSYIATETALRTSGM